MILIGRLIHTIFFIFRPIRLKREDDLTKGAMLKFFCEALERHPDLSLFLTQVKRTTPPRTPPARHKLARLKSLLLAFRR